MIWEVDEDCDRCAASGPQTRTQRASPPFVTTATAAESVAPCRCRCVNWEEFKVMFYRVRKDKSGWEPRRLFAVVEFMMHDSVVEVTPWQCPSSAPAPPQGAPGGSGQLGTPRERPAHIGAQPLPRVLEPASPKAAHFTAF